MGTAREIGPRHMPYSLKIDSARRRVAFKATGVFSKDEVLGAIKDMLAHPEFRPGTDALIDLSEVEDVPLSGADVRDKVELDKALLTEIGNARWAFVATRDVVYGLTRMFQLLMNDTPIAVETFRDTRAAEAWLGDVDPRDDTRPPTP